jgi:hypothetical protein
MIFRNTPPYVDLVVASVTAKTEMLDALQNRSLLFLNFLEPLNRRFDSKWRGREKQQLTQQVFITTGSNPWFSTRCAEKMRTCVPLSRLLLMVQVWLTCLHRFKSERTRCSSRTLMKWAAHIQVPGHGSVSDCKIGAVRTTNKLSPD